MKVAALQLDVVWEDPAANHARARELAGRARDRGAELVVLPEMFNTGFTMAAATAAEHAAGTRAFLAGLARELGCAVLGGHAAPGGARPCNTATLCLADGTEALRYRKIHAFTMDAEHEHYETGRAVGTAAVAGVRVTPLICYDLRFPELFRAAATATDLFVVIASWPARRGHAWRTLLPARAIENLAFVLGVNRVGTGGGVEHVGDSTLADPLGEVVATLAGEEGVVVGDVDPAAVADARRRLPFLRDRREDVYAELRLARGPGEEPVP